MLDVMKNENDQVEGLDLFSDFPTELKVENRGKTLVNVFKHYLTDEGIEETGVNLMKAYFNGIDQDERAPVFIYLLNEIKMSHPDKVEMFLTEAQK